MAASCRYRVSQYWARSGSCAFDSRLKRSARAPHLIAGVQSSGMVNVEGGTLLKIKVPPASTVSNSYEPANAGGQFVSNDRGGCVVRRYVEGSPGVPAGFRV